MANRYTDLDKWDDDWFLSLSPVMKCVWNYLCDNVKGCGELKISFKKLSDCIGETIDRADFDRVLEGRVIWIEEDVVWVPGTLARIYKKLSAVPAHINAAKKIIRMTEGISLSPRGLKALNRFKEFLNSTTTPVPEQAPDGPRTGPALKEKREERKEKREILGKGGMGEKPKPPANYTAFANSADPRFDFESLFEAYPRKEGRELGMRIIRSQIASPEEFQDFSKAVAHYVALCAKRKTEISKIKSWSSFVSFEGTRPWLDYVQRPKELDLVSADRQDAASYIASIIAQKELQGAS